MSRMIVTLAFLVLLVVTLTVAEKVVLFKELSRFASHGLLITKMKSFRISLLTSLSQFKNLFI